MTEWGPMSADLSGVTWPPFVIRISSLIRHSGFVIRSSASIRHSGFVIRISVFLSHDLPRPLVPARLARGGDPAGAAPAAQPPEQAHRVQHDALLRRGVHALVQARPRAGPRDHGPAHRAAGAVRVGTRAAA